MGRSFTYAFVFVCQAGPLESKALLLAASLKRHLSCPYELLAAVPTPVETWGALAPATKDLLEKLGGRTVPIANEIDPAYPIGNKVSCLRVRTGADRLVFLDTDMLLVREFAGDPRFAVPFAAKPADLPNVSHPRQWRRAYAAARLKPPEGRVATTLYGQIVPPYFNAGFVAVDPKAGLGNAWLECCRRIHAKWGIRLKRPHLDQIALPVAVHKLGLPYDCLDERYNFPAHLKPLDNANPPLFVHYHGPHVLRREPVLVDLARQLCEEEPALAERVRGDPDLAPLLRPRAGAPVRGSRAGEPTPELIITGLPRSGTSYLCNLLHRYENCVILNEPEGISRPLRKEPIPYGVGTFYRDVRRDILEGRPIRNKLKDGKVTDETMEANEQTEYTPAVTGEDFVLGAKSPLGFLSRLDALRRAMPRARIVVCVRNPFDVIASWKTTFSHLKTADVADLTHGGLRDPFLSARHRSALEDVARVKHPAWRRAAWWRYLADLILDAAPHVILVPYPVAVTDPVSVVGRILEGFNPGTLREPIEPSTIRAGKRTALDEEDYQAIRALCGEAAAALGVDDGWGEAYASARRPDAVSDSRSPDPARAVAAT